MKEKKEKTIEEIGKEGEQIAVQYFKEKKIQIQFQADKLIKENGVWKLYEIKHQKVFVPPPFYGHGLPPWQVKSRLEFYKETRIEPFLFIVELSDYGFCGIEGYKTIWIASLIKLEMTNYFDTPGDDRRRVYAIKHFEEHRQLWKKE